VRKAGSRNESTEASRIGKQLGEFMKEIGFPCQTTYYEELRKPAGPAAVGYPPPPESIRNTESLFQRGRGENCARAHICPLKVRLLPERAAVDPSDAAQHPRITGEQGSRLCPRKDGRDALRSSALFPMLESSFWRGVHDETTENCRNYSGLCSTFMKAWAVRSRLPACGPYTGRDPARGERPSV